MMLACLPVPDPAVEGLAELVRAVGADDLAERLERAVADGVELIALTLDERPLLLAALEDPPQELAELRAVPARRPPVETRGRAGLNAGITPSDA